MRGRGLVARRIEIVAERGAKRLLVAARDPDLFHDRRPIMHGRQKLHQRRKLGFELLARELRLGGQGPSLGFRRMRLLLIGLRRLQLGLDALHRRGKLGQRSIQAGKLGIAAALGLALGKLLLELAQLRLKPGAAHLDLGLLAVEPAALGARLGKRRGRLAQGLLGGFKDLLGPGRRFAQLRLLAIARACHGETPALLAKPAQHAFGLGDMLLLAGEVAGGLRQPRLELGLPRLGAGLLALQRIALDAQAMQHGRARSLLVAQRLEFLGRLGLLAQCLAFGLGVLRDLGERLLERRFLLLDMGAGAGPMQMMLERLGLADLAGDFTVALRLARLAPQSLQLRCELADQVGKPREIGFGRLQAKLGLMAAAMQAGNARGIFEHAAALLRRGIDDLADAALPHQRRRARAGRGILEQEPHVARARILAVDLIGRARLAFDSPRHFQHVAVVELGRRRARAIVDEQGDLGAVARRAVFRAREDHVLHGAAAHALIRGLAHGPAQRLEQVRLAAAIGTDHAGQARLDQKLGRLDERLESEKAKTSDLHAGSTLLVEPLRTGPDHGRCPGNDQDGVAGGGGACSIMALISSKVTSPWALRPLMKKVGVPITLNCRPRCFTSVKPSIMV